MIRITDHPNLSSAVYAPNFEKVDGAYCFWSVGAWLHVSQNSSMGSALGMDRSTPPTGVTRVSNNEPANICQEYI